MYPSLLGRSSVLPNHQQSTLEVKRPLRPNHLKNNSAVLGVQKKNNDPRTSFPRSLFLTQSIYQTEHWRWRLLRCCTAADQFPLTVPAGCCTGGARDGEGVARVPSARMVHSCAAEATHRSETSAPTATAGGGGGGGPGFGGDTGHGSGWMRRRW
jgi:hypothetical protein